MSQTESVVLGSTLIANASMRMKETPENPSVHRPHLQIVRGFGRLPGHRGFEPRTPPTRDSVSRQGSAYRSTDVPAVSVNVFVVIKVRPRLRFLNPITDQRLFGRRYFLSSQQHACTQTCSMRLPTETTVWTLRGG